MASAPQCMQVARVLFPALLAIVNSPSEYGATVRRRALQIAHSMAVMLAGIQGNADRDSSRAIGSLLDAWFQPLCVMLSQSTSAHVQTLLPPPYSVCRDASVAMLRFPRQNPALTKAYSFLRFAACTHVCHLREPEAACHSVYVTFGMLLLCLAPLGRMWAGGV